VPRPQDIPRQDRSQRRRQRRIAQTAAAVEAKQYTPLLNEVPGIVADGSSPPVIAKLGPPKRGRKPRPVAQAADAIVGEVYVPILKEHLARLREASAHPNRTLHWDTVLVSLLLGFFNTADNSLRMLEDLSCCEESQPMTGGRIPRCTMSDAMASMNPTLLLPIVQTLMKRVPGLRHVDGDLAALLKTIVAADGSIFTLPADVLWGIALTRSNGKVGRQLRLDLQLDVLQFMPLGVGVDGAEQGNEAAAFAKQLLPGVIYLCDRNFVNYDFLRRVLEVGSDFVVRLKSDTGFFVTQERELTDEDRKAGVVYDRIGHLSDAFGDNTRTFREVGVIDPRTRKTVRLLTTLLDVAAKVIGKLYRHRWVVELFFKWLKCVAKLRHLVSHSKNGITIQFYVAVIIVLLTHLRTGHKPGVYEINCLAWVADGKMSVQAMHEVLTRRQRERDLNNARLARKQAAQKQI